MIYDCLVLVSLLDIRLQRSVKERAVLEKVLFKYVRGIEIDPKYLAGQPIIYREESFSVLVVLNRDPNVNFERRSG